MKILIIKPSSLGDVIHALPFLKALKDQFPEATIDWVISKSLKGLIEGNPLINRLLVFEKDSWKSIKKIPGTLSEILAFRKILKTEHYDLVVDLQGLLRSGIIAHVASAERKVGFASAREGSRMFYDTQVSVNGRIHAVDKCLEIAKSLGAKSIGAKVEKVEFPLTVSADSGAKVRGFIGDIEKYILIAPSARWDTKRWSPERFASLIKESPLPCILTGSKEDSELGQHIANMASDNAINLCGRTNLKELIALIAGSELVISNDSGSMHIAAALDIPTIAIFGPTDPSKTGPYGWQKNSNLKVIKVDVRCSPCRKRRCRDMRCMKEISVESVLEAQKEIIP